MMAKRIPRPYIDRGKPGTLRYQGGVLLTVVEPKPAERRMLTLQVLRRHNTLEPQLQETHRILLRWSESGGTGMPNPEADVRETHYDPLPEPVREQVDKIVDDCPWTALIRKRYRTNMGMTELADFLCVSRSQLYSDLRAALWYLRGRFEAERVHG